MQRGSIGSFFVFGVLALLIVVGVTAVGGLPPDSFPETGQQVIAVSPTQGANHDTLQLKTFGYVTIAPTPVPSSNSLCNDKSVNTEPEILSAYSPASGQSVGNDGQIKVWVSDEGAPFISLGEIISPTDGSITTPGNRGQTAPDGYLWEPALYVDQLAENSGGAHFPNIIKGTVSDNPPVGKQQESGPAIDPLPAGSSPSGCKGFGSFCYEAEYIWNVSSLGLSAGEHDAEFVIHDGDRDRGVGCVTINIQ